MASGKNHDRAITITTPVLMAAAIASGHADVGLIATAMALAPLPASHPPPSALVVSRARDRFDSSVTLPGSFGQSIVAPLPRSPANPMVRGYGFKCVGIPDRSRTICLESSAT
jgi:hypothetical protein